jgi:hypothetical protein
MTCGIDSSALKWRRRAPSMFPLSVHCHQPCCVHMSPVAVSHPSGTLAGAALLGFALPRSSATCRAISSPLLGRYEINGPASAGPNTVVAVAGISITKRPKQTVFVFSNNDCKRGDKEVILGLFKEPAEGRRNAICHCHAQANRTICIGETVQISELLVYKHGVVAAFDRGKC